MPGILYPRGGMLNPAAPPLDPDEAIGWVPNPLNPNNEDDPSRFRFRDPIVKAAQAHDIPLALSGRNRAAISTLGPIQQQKILRKLGFNITVDGKSGPQTASAVWAYVHGHNAGWFNNKGADWQQALWNKLTPAAAAAKKATAQTKPVHPNNSKPPLPSDAQASGPSIDPVAAILGVGGRITDGGGVGKLLDRAKAGASAAELGFGSTIRDLERRVELAPKESASHKKEIQGWYGSLLAKARSLASSESGVADDLISATSAQGADIARSFGGDASLAAGELASSGEAEAANLRALKLIGSQGASEMESATRQTGLNATLRQAALDAAAERDLRAQLQDQTAAAGATYEKAAQDADTQNTAIQQQRFQNNIAAAQARIAAIASGADVTYKSAMAAKAAAAAKNGGSTAKKLPKGSWANTSAADKGKVADLANQTITNLASSGADTPTIIHAIKGIYAGRGWSLTNPNVRRAMLAAAAGAGLKVTAKDFA